MRGASRSTSRERSLKAGDRADELAPLIEAFLERAPRRKPSAEALAYVRSLDDPPMLRARVAKALRVDDVVDAIVAACEIQPDARPKVRRYYQQLEGGVLDPSRVAAAVWDAITEHARPFARVADGAGSRCYAVRRPHVPGRPAIRAGRDADTVGVDDGARTAGRRRRVVPRRPELAADVGLSADGVQDVPLPSHPGTQPGGRQRLRAATRCVKPLPLRQPWQRSRLARSPAAHWSAHRAVVCLVICAHERVSVESSGVRFATRVR